ncbi:MAG TPA: phosphoenolpyruvate--protein phosphotransferase [Acetobacteraceae bacterium]|jgi:phosphotransferase system enzyme I (PtsI)|nr:phosphoenolpyruvate--protein phosphotransferase [Acetobacteraceae bacterium]
MRGIAVSEGIAIGPVFGAVEPPVTVNRRSIVAEAVDAEIARLDQAIAQSRKQLHKLRARLALLPDDSQAEIAPLLDAYLAMIGPSRLVRGAKRRIGEALVAAETAVFDETDALARAFLAMPPADDRAGRQRRADEVREIGRRLLRNLTHAPFRSFADLPQGAILACEYLRPADAALLDPSRLAGAATEEGGSDGHTAIMLRALGVPAVLGVVGLMSAAKPGDQMVLDGFHGELALHPSTATLSAARTALTAAVRERQKLARLRRLPAVTTDGEAVELQANLELPAELPLISQAGACGIGLLRSEFLFMNRETLPSEADQAEVYRNVIEAMGGDPVTIRVLDWGGEKEIEALESEGIVPEVADDNPALGLRGIRLLLRETELFETQLAAILRAAVAGPTRVLLPMITNLAEVRAARDIYERVGRRLRRRGEHVPDPLPPLGIMIETPGAALSADALALESDFFAIGTNDLAMYTLAVDRSETDVAQLYDPLHPAVLRLVQFATEAALRMRMPVSVCGELAGNPKMTALLLGLGLRSLSMNAGSLPRVKQAVRGLDIADCARFARRVMEQSDVVRIHEMVLDPTRAANP